MRVFLDTNIFLYAAGAPHPRREACARVLERLAEGALDGTVNTVVLQEILYVLLRRGRRDDALTLAGHVAALFPDLLPVTRDDMMAARSLMLKYPRLSVRDSVHVATMMQHGLKTIVSLDSDFDRISEIRRLDPASV